MSYNKVTELQNKILDGKTLFNELKFQIIRALDKGGVTIDEGGQCGYTLLMVAAQKNNYELMEFLLKKLNASINITHNGGGTASHIAARHGNKEALEVLINENADFNLMHNGDTPSKIAEAYGHRELSSWIIKQENKKKDNICINNTVNLYK